VLDSLVYHDELVDYAVTALECTPTANLQRCTTTVERQGGAVLPVEVEFTFADGRRERQAWDGQDGEKVFVHEQTVPLDAAQVDPDRKILLDREWFDNSRTREVQTVPLVRMLSSWLYALEQFILAMGGLW
jgi:hypothetical protein